MRPATIIRWLEHARATGPFALHDMGEADALEMLAFCDQDEELASSVRRVRLRAVIQRVFESGPLDIPRRLGVRRGAESASATPESDEQLLARLLAAAARDPRNDAEREHDEVLDDLVGLMLRRAPATEWADAATHWATRWRDTAGARAPETAHAAAVLAVMGGDVECEIQMLERAVTLTAPGTEARLSYCRILAAALWRAAEGDRACAVIEAAADAAAEDDRWKLLADLAQVGEGYAGGGCVDPATIAADRVWRRILREGSRDGRFSVSERHIRTLQRVKANELTRVLRTQAWDLLPDAVSEASVLFRPVDRGAWAQTALATGLFRQGRFTEALDVLDDVLRELPDHQTRPQPLRLSVLRALIARGGDDLICAARAFPDGLPPADCADLVAETSLALSNAHRASEAADSAAQLLRRVPALTDSEADPVIDLLCEKAVGEGGDGPWRRHLHRLIDTEAPPRVQLLVARAVITLTETGGSSGAGDLAAAVRLIRAMPNGNIKAARTLTLVATRVAKDAGDEPAARRLAELACDIGPVEVGSRDEGASLVAYAEALALAERPREAFDAALRAASLGSEAEVLLDAVDCAARWSDLTDSAHETALDALDAALELRSAGTEQGRLRLRRLERALAAGETETALRRLEHALDIASRVHLDDLMMMAAHSMTFYRLDRSQMHRWATAILSSVELIERAGARVWTVHLLRGRAHAADGDAARATREWADARRAIERDDALHEPLVHMIVRMLKDLARDHRSLATEALADFAQWHDDMEGADPALSRVFAISRIVVDETWTPTSAPSGDMDVPPSRGVMLGAYVRRILQISPWMDQIRPIGAHRSGPLTDSERHELTLDLTDVELLAHHVTAAAPENLQEASLVQLLATVHDGRPHDWGELASPWIDVQPLTCTAARVLATVAVSAGDHRLASELLAEAMRLTDDQREIHHLRRCRARSALLDGRPDIAIALLTEAARELLSHEPRDVHAMWLLEDLIDSHLEAAIAPSVVQRCTTAALATWSSLSRPGDIPSPAPTATPGTWESADYRLRKAACRALGRQDMHPESAISTLTDFLESYPDGPDGDWARTGVVLHTRLSRGSVEALRRLDAYIDAANEPPSDDLLDLRRLLMRGVVSDDAGAVEFMLHPPPKKLPPTARWQGTMQAAHLLNTWGYPDDAATFLGRELFADTSSPLDDLPSALGDFLDERIDGDAWRWLCDRIIDAPENEVDEGVRKTLLWRRAFRRKGEGDTSGAVDDVLRRSQYRREPHERRDARRLLALARAWPDLAPDQVDAIVEQEISIGEPPEDSSPADYAAELQQWTAMLAAIGRDEPDVHRVALEAAIIAQNDDDADRALRRFVIAAQNMGAGHGARWSQTLGDVITRLGDERFLGARTLAHWYRARNRHADHDDHAAVDDVESLTILAALPDLPVHRVCDALDLICDACDWPQVTAAQRAQWCDVVIAVTDALQNEQSNQRQLLISRARAQNELGLTEAWDSLRAATDAAHAGSGEERDAIAWGVRHLIRRQGSRVDSAARVDEFFRWHRSGASVKPLVHAKWFSERLLERGCADPVIGAWREIIAQHANPQLLPETVHALVEVADSQVRDPATAQALLDLADSAGLDDEQWGTDERIGLLSLRAVLHAHHGDLDQAHDLLREAERRAAQIPAVEARTYVYFIIYVRRLIITNRVESTNASHEQLMSALAPDSGISDTLRTQITSTLNHTDQNKRTTTRARFPDIHALTDYELGQIMSEQFSRWSADDVLGAEVLRWFDRIRHSPASSANRRTLVATAHGMWAVMSRQTLTSPSEEEHDDRRQSIDAKLEPALDALRSALSATQEDHSPAIILGRSEWLVAAAVMTMDYSDREIARGHARWIFDECAAAALSTDARAAASKLMQRRQEYLADSEDAWSAALMCAAILDDWHLIAETIALHRSSLILERDRRTTVVQLMPRLWDDEGDPLGEASDEASAPDQRYAHAASGSVLADIDSGVRIAARPRPLVRLPDGTIALETHLRGLRPEERNQWVTPVVVDLA